jgi:DHA1 family tetracycline resistance protein-like MFS transporter
MAPDIDDGGREFAILIYAIFVSMLGIGIVLPLLPFFGKAFNATPFEIMALFSLYSLGNVIGEPLWGRLSDRLGRRPVLLGTSLAYAVSFTLLAFSSNLTFALIVRFLGGLCSANTSVVLSIIADVSPARLMTKRVSRYWVSFQFGLIIGPVVGGILAVPAMGPEGFRVPLLVAAFLSLLSTTGLYLFVKESGAHRRSAIPGLGASEGFSAASHQYMAIVLLIAQTFVAGVAFRGIDGVFALWAQHQFQWQPIDVGLCIGIASSVATVCQLAVLPYLGQKLGELLALITLLVAGGIFLTIIPSGTTFATISALMAGYMVCASFCSSYTAALIIRRSQIEMAGRTAGFNNSAAALARVTGPLLFAAAFAYLGPNSPFFFAAILMLPAVALVATVMLQERS